MDAARLAVTLYMETQVLTGFIYQPYGERLLDLLNGIFVRQPENRGRFLKVSDITIHHPDGKKERLPTAYINKSTIHLAAVSDGDSARGIGAEAGPKFYPFVQKSSVPIRLRTPAYALTGSTYCFSGQKIWHVLEEKLIFLPVTNARIRAAANGISWVAPFVAVNKEQILSLQEEEIALSSSPLTRTS